MDVWYVATFINFYTLNNRCEDILSHLHNFEVRGTKPGFKTMLDHLGLCSRVCFGHNSPHLSAFSLHEDLYAHLRMRRGIALSFSGAPLDEPNTLATDVVMR